MHTIKPVVGSRCIDPVILNPLCTKLIIWKDSSTCHHNKAPTEKGQLMGNPVYTLVEGCSPQAIWFMKEQIQKYARKHIKGGCYLKVTLGYRGLTSTLDGIGKIYVPTAISQ
jgi:hypothetical protein